MPATAGRAVLGVSVFSKAILVIPKTLVTNAGHDAQEMILKGKQVISTQGDAPVGFDLDIGDTLSPAAQGIWDLYTAKAQIVDARYVCV